MLFDSVRNVKAEVFENVFDFQSVAIASDSNSGVPLFIPRQDTSAFRNIKDGRGRNRRDPRDMISLGVLAPDGHNKIPDGFKLAIFIQRADLQNHPYVQSAQRQARGEARVIYTGPVQRRALNPGRHRPLRIGSSVGHYGISAGSIGCFCAHRDGGGIGILSNNHVLANTNKANIGDIILQPGRKDGGKRRDIDSRVATLFSFEHISFDVDARNLVDCAFANLLGGVEYDGAAAYCPTSNRQWPVKSKPVQLIAGDAVWKLGRKTARTDGFIVATDIDNVVVAMGSGTGQRLARFDNQISIECTTEHFSQGGDSGSLICASDGSPAALLFAGTERGGSTGFGLTFANPIETVLDVLNLDIHTGS
ncbi:hypothetical protein [Methylobacterium indicum]|uniref:hypothetical protein n=1 Tax=Methylobacterium indicum TaxID=1775910 RepID=UPI000AC68C7F|nr:hypothetical protein [Methylobacterium indicum]